MSLEQFIDDKIQQILDNYDGPGFYPNKFESCCGWHLRDMVDDKDNILDEINHHWNKEKQSQKDNDLSWHPNYDSVYCLINLEVDKIIREADLSECLTSPSEYVREYRKWWENNKDD